MVVLDFCFPNLKVNQLKNKSDARLPKHRRKSFPIFEGFSDGDSIKVDMWITITVQHINFSNTCNSNVFFQKLFVRICIV